MKLFIFEGAKREKQVFDSLEHLFFPARDEDQRVICCYESNIYNLYQRYMRYGVGADLVSVLREYMQGREDNPFTDEMIASDFGEIYLFFDYDFHDKRYSIEEINHRLEEMLQVFNDETENGKLYISYPMIEALRYTKQLPDNAYPSYVVDRMQSHDFKRLAADFSFYKDGWDFLTVHDGDSEEKRSEVRSNWRLSKEQNAKKANWLCSDVEDWPESHEAIAQEKIFASQCAKYVIPYQSVSVLSAFAIFLYDYEGE